MQMEILEVPVTFTELSLFQSAYSLRIVLPEN